MEVKKHQLTPSPFPLFLTSAAGSSPRLAEPGTRFIQRDSPWQTSPAEGGGAAGSCRQSGGGDNGSRLLLKMEDELIEAQGACDVKGWGLVLRAQEGGRGPTSV